MVANSHIVKYITILLLFFVCLVGCKNKRTTHFEVPDVRKMVIILADIHVAEATISEKSTPILAEEQIGVFNYTLQKYGLNKEEFDSAIAYYSAQPVLYQKIYEDVLVLLTEKEMSVRALQDDSINTTKTPKENIKISRRNIWTKNRVYRISSLDSSMLNAVFKVRMDSISGGDIRFVAKYKFRSKETVNSTYAMKLFANYSDGSRDSTKVIIYYSKTSNEYTAQISLKNQIIKEVSGTLITSESNNPFRVEVSDIQLDWRETLSKVK